MPPSSNQSRGLSGMDCQKLQPAIYYILKCFVEVESVCNKPVSHKELWERRTYPSPSRGVLQSLPFNSRVGFPSQQSISLLLLLSSMKWFWGLEDWKKTSFENQTTVSVARSAVSTKQAPVSGTRRSSQAMRQGDAHDSATNWYTSSSEHPKTFLKFWLSGIEFFYTSERFRKIPKGLGKFPRIWAFSQGSEHFPKDLQFSQGLPI